MIAKGKLLAKFANSNILLALGYTQTLFVLSSVYTAYQYQGDSFSPQRLKNYSLRILVRDQLLVYVVLDKDNKILVTREYHSKSHLEMNEFLNLVKDQDYFLKEDYGSSQVVSGTLAFSLIPNQFFVSDRVKEFAGTLVRETADPGTAPDHLEYLEMDKTGATAIFTVPSSLKEKCDAWLDGPDYIPSCHPLIKMASELTAPGEDLLMTTLFSNQFVVTGMKNGRLMLCNSYDYRSAADLVYFIQLVSDMLELGDSAKILINGDIDPEGQLYSQLKDLVPRTQIPVDFLQNRFDSPSKGIPYHRFAFLSF